VYDHFSSDYDRFVNWPSRLQAEMPFILQKIGPARDPKGQPLQMLDAACGTGMHVVALAKEGYAVAGADLSSGMIDYAFRNAQASDIQARFEVAGFGGLAERFGVKAFHALLCLGNSLPHLLDTQALQSAIADFAACLRPGGVLLVQNRNFDAVLANKERWMEPQSYQDIGREWLFLRFYDFEPDGLLTFNIFTLRREDGSPWKQQVSATRLWPIRQFELAGALSAAGFSSLTWYGNMMGDPFNPGSSGNLVCEARLDG
jgi:glycine/sarcosine N-methyltransferase